jgi:hypothetical protein
MRSSLFAGPEPDRLTCEHCGCVEHVALPMPAPAYCLMLNALIEKHRHCRAHALPGEVQDG